MANTFKYGEAGIIINNNEYIRNDILVFYQNDSVAGYRLSDIAALRLIGLPGEHIEISKGVIKLNGKHWSQKTDKKRGYIIDISGFADYNATVAFLRPYTGYPLNDDYALINLDEKEYKLVGADRKLFLFEEFTTDTLSDSILVQKINVLRMQKDSMPETVIPKKGDTITINQENQIYYKHVIKDSKPIGNDRYIMMHNAYFVVGDNWMEATDSRYYGVVNEKSIIGKLNEPKK